jgi:hypothetical protein
MGGKGNAVTVLEAIDEVLKMPRWAGYFEGFSFPYAFYGRMIIVPGWQPWAFKLIG